MKQTVILVIVDGFGIGNLDESNPIHAAKPKIISEIQSNFPGGALHASGNVVGLSWQEEGSSSLGHLMIGSGRIAEEKTMSAIKEVESGKIDINKPVELIHKTLGEILTNNEKFQLRIAETARENQVTYIFSGFRKDPFPNEYRVIIPSERAARPDEYPEMRARAITDRLIIAIKEGTFDFILVNYANADIVASTGNYDATIKAVETIDRELERVVKAAYEENHILIVTSSHGNAENVMNLKTGLSQKTNDASPVPFYIVGKKFILPKPNENPFRPHIIGMLPDIAPTILNLMRIQKPDEMTGESLLPQLGM